MTIAKIAVALLQLALLFVEWAKQKQAIDAGYDKAIAETSVAILKKTEAAKAVLGRVTGMTESQVDQALKDLEP